MFSIISFRKIKKKNRISNFFTPAKAILEKYQDDFGIINVYTILYYKNKEKAFSALSNSCTEKIYTENSEVPKSYLTRLYCEQIITEAKQHRNATLTLYYTPEKRTLISLTRNFKTVYIQGATLPDFTEEIWEECGTLPIVCNFPPQTDYKITGNETPTLKVLPKPYDEICPKDFPKTLFAGLLYKENGIFIS